MPFIKPLSSSKVVLSFSKRANLVYELPSGHRLVFSCHIHFMNGQKRVLPLSHLYSEFGTLLHTHRLKHRPVNATFAIISLSEYASTVSDLYAHPERGFTDQPLTPSRMHFACLLAMRVAGVAHILLSCDPATFLDLELVTRLETLVISPSTQID
jgi:hypothetical protein